MITAYLNNREITAKEFYNQNLHLKNNDLLDGYEKLYKVSFVNSYQKIKHFRYFPNVRPEWHKNKYGKGEGEDHLKLKEMVYQCLNTNGYECKKEHYFSQINRRADVCEVNRKIVYEIQVSYISEADLLQRTKDYAKLGYITFWYINPFRSHYFDLSKGWLFRLDFGKSNILKYYASGKLLDNHYYKKNTI